MTRYLALTGLALSVAAASLAIDVTVTPAAAATPVCVGGFQTVLKNGWLLKCRKTVPIALKGVTLTQAYNANCTPDSYWNYGPAVTSTTHPARHTVTVNYTCGHVED